MGLMLSTHDAGKTEHQTLRIVLLFLVHEQVCKQCDTLKMHYVPALSTHFFQAAVRFSLVGLDSVATLTL